MARQSDPVERSLWEDNKRLARLARPAPVAAGTDREGMPEMTGIGGLAEIEQNVRRRFSPRRNRWRDVARFDERAGELERRQADVTRQLNELQTTAANAPGADADALAAWHLNPKGAKPEPTEPRLRERIDELQREHAALTRATTVVLSEKAEYVAKHRGRLEKDAHKAVEQHAERLRATIDQIQRERAELADCRQAELWAACYPDAEAGQEPPTHLLAGGRVEPARKAGLNQAVEVQRVVGLLRDDAAWLATATTPGQKARLDGRDPRQPKGAVWTDTPEGRQQDRAEKDAALRRHEELWGTRPA
jgi:hypothetical protein